MRKCICNLRHYLLFEIGSVGEGCKVSLEHPCMKQEKFNYFPENFNT